MAKFKSICVYCGSSTGRDEGYKRAAITVSDHFLKENITLVNGGGSIGLMGVMADRMLNGGGKAIGVIPMSLKEKEVAHVGMTELIVVPDMHARKLTMVNLSDAFICLPGGFGTLDELFETLTWSQLHLHKKPIGILNVDGYFDTLIQMMDFMVTQDFVRAEARHLVHVDNDVAQLLQRMSQPQKYAGVKWDRIRSG